jgi:predicted LPLAT superfamily acyltransferase
MIPALEDMSHIFLMNEALANGEIVSIPGDRIYGSPRFLECDFLGSKARFPLGPYAMALQRGVPTVTIFVMKESAYRYTAYIRRIEATEGKTRQERAASLAQHFAHELETILRKYPEQWFNYYEFWNHDEDAA